MQKRNLRPAVWLTALFSLIALSCSPDKEIINDSPADKLSESEKLVIPAAIDLPVNLPGGNTRMATLYANCVQQYKAGVKADSFPATCKRVFVAPKGNLFDASNKKIGTRGEGPFRELSVADSIFAQPFSPAKTARPDANSNLWLHLMSKDGKIPTSIFSNTAVIQRSATTGGKSPGYGASKLNRLSRFFLFYHLSFHQKELATIKFFNH